MRTPRELRREFKLARKRGWRFRDAKGHIVCYPPAGEMMTVSTSASDNRAVANARADFKRRGVVA